MQESFEEQESKTPCFFCRRMEDTSSLQKRVVYENELYHVSRQLDENAKTFLGLLLIQTKRHVRDLADLSDSEALIKKISKALKASTGAAWTYSYSFLEGHRHVRVIVAARYPGLPKEYARLSISDWPELPVGDQEQVYELSSRLRSLL